MEENEKKRRARCKITYQPPRGEIRTIPSGSRVHFTILGGQIGLAQVEVCFSEDKIVCMARRGTGECITMEI